MTTTTKERPILFSGPLVRAILAGRKTVTRRVVKPQLEGVMPSAHCIRLVAHPFSESALKGTPAQDFGRPDALAWVAEDWCGNQIGIEEKSWIRCPFGQPGDRLWVREAFWLSCPDGFDAADCNITDPHGEPRVIDYDATMDDESRRCALDFSVRKRPSIHMPRWASRITLEVTEVRVERVQEITHKDALAEGCMGEDWVASSPYIEGPHTDAGELPVEEFQRLWDGIYAKRGHGWDANPWVWVVRFKRIEGEA